MGQKLVFFRERFLRIYEDRIQRILCSGFRLQRSLEDSNALSAMPVIDQQ